jgi:hypothetical protein
VAYLQQDRQIHQALGCLFRPKSQKVVGFFVKNYTFMNDFQYITSQFELKSAQRIPLEIKHLIVHSTKIFLHEIFPELKKVSMSVMPIAQNRATSIARFMSCLYNLSKIKLHFSCVKAVEIQ